MTLLSISDPQIWLLAGISVATVFAILLILVAILGIFSKVAQSTSGKATKQAVASNPKPVASASEDDKAAVAMALYLYFEEMNNSESHKLTIVPTPNSAWGARLNPRL